MVSWLEVGGHEDGARGDGVDHDGGGEFFSENAGEGDDAALGDEVGRVVDVGPVDRPVGDVDDFAAAALAHVEAKEPAAGGRGP